jgi:hypothetical protein
LRVPERPATYEYMILHVFPDHFTAGDKLLARSRLERATK